MFPTPSDPKPVEKVSFVTAAAVSAACSYYKALTAVMMVSDEGLRSGHRRLRRGDPAAPRYDATYSNRCRAGAIVSRDWRKRLQTTTNLRLKPDDTRTLDSHGFTCLRLNRPTTHRRL
jgi:hypothetical protein